MIISMFIVKVLTVYHVTRGLVPRQTENEKRRDETERDNPTNLTSDETTTVHFQASSVRRVS